MAIGDKRPVVMEADRAAAGGIATLGADGKLLDAQIPGLDKLGAAPAGYGLGGYAAVLDAVDINTVRQNGWYRLLSNCTNAPTTSDGVSSCSGALLEVIGSTTSYVTEQRIYLGTASQQGRMLRRFYNNVTQVWQPWEWINPPMKEGVEYRTTERYLGKPVYVKVIDFGALPAATYKGVSHGVSDVDKMFPPYGQTSDNWSIPTKSYGGSMNDTVGTTVDVTMSKTDIYINTDRDRSSATATVVIKYTKTTD